MKEEIKQKLIESKSKTEASIKIFGYHNSVTFKKIDNYLEKLGINYDKIKIERFCNVCGGIIKSKNKNFCSRSCAASYTNKKRGPLSEETKKKIGEKNKLKYKTKKLIIVECNWCKKKFETTKRKGRKSCSTECEINFNRDHLKRIGKVGCLKSVESQNRRSKNEIYLSELCSKEFKNIRLNEQIFNGWDADIILDDYKLAIMWDGNWHHKKLSKGHSLEQVQNRDKIRIKEIINCGYTPYTINDYGKYNKHFVEKEFEKLKEYIAP